MVFHSDHFVNGQYRTLLWMYSDLHLLIMFQLISKMFSTVSLKTNINHWKKRLVAYFSFCSKLRWHDHWFNEHCFINWMTMITSDLELAEFDDENTMIEGFPWEMRLNYSSMMTLYTIIFSTMYHRHWIHEAMTIE